MLFKHAPVSIKVLLSTVDWDIDCMNEIFRCCFFLFVFFFLLFFFLHILLLQQDCNHLKPSLVVFRKNELYSNIKVRLSFNFDVIYNQLVTLTPYQI